MKRLLFSLVLVLLAAATIVLGQSVAPATLRTGAGDRPLAVAQQGGLTLYSVSDVIAGLGGTVTPDSSGFKVSLNNVVAAFGPDSRFGVVREDLIEMPAPPLILDGKPFVAIQFLQGFLPRAAGLEAQWDASAHVLQIRPQQHEAVGVQVSVANVQGISKIVVTLSGPAEYAIVREPGAFTVRFRTAIRPPFTEQAFDDPYVQKATFAGNDLRIQLTAVDVAGDAYRLDAPFRIVLDLRKAAAAPAGTPPPPLSLRPVDQPGIRTIVIDPGHGGKEVGAIGPSGMMEKDVTLALCRRLASSLSAKTGARVVLTREDDSVVSLDQRTAVANQYKADLFLSVHMNAAVVRDARGSEVYFLSADASDDLARKAADAENAVSAKAAPASSNELQLILWDLAQQEYLQESSRFAQAIQEEMNALSGIQNRGVKQAPFKVLVGATMPAALVEVAFISNPDEEAKLKNDTFQSNVIDALTRAVVRYKTDYETRIGVIRPSPAKAGAAQTTPVTQTAPAPQTTPLTQTAPQTAAPAPATRTEVE